ncbi:unnamed protein product [Cryptosporidium hominis]|uniref:Uncharacterized protein n=1 Tax=Cryptosporidium hominis TaxID=237895 RepID=A0A0S4TJJ8_CRYHO|nr:hypothetical protein [Cryptosporidium hominis TU502]OLQ17986.1 hypothetical protein ChTU502y2012_407g1570 [Cryptosporidium hominis]PPA64054.1 hypothetical protein ChUKH1_04585 [Cryptosporidium hominis]PPS93975.1 Uncharacterized protein GY17_00003038 [Cryptosporidium hominis]CUV07307.1 unnamed protein product [Cryptosporidium hominis]|eukprot:PPS93975.1 Uncharacterized protein GY17_00003038 [Cryptosporidium hominis]
MFQLRSGPPTSRGASEFGTPNAFSHRNNQVPQYTQRANPLMCCSPPQINSMPINQAPPSRMISAAGLNVQSVNAPSRLVTGASITPAAVVAAPERQVTEPLQHKQTFIYGGSETMEPEDCGWLEPIRLKVHAMEVQQYINPSNPEATPPFIYNVDHLMECVEIPENWAPESVTGVAALTFENLNTNPPVIQHPLRLESDGSKNGTNNPYIQPIRYHVERIKDKDSPEKLEKIIESDQDVTSPSGSKKDNETITSNSNFFSAILSKIKNGVKLTSDKQAISESKEESFENNELEAETVEDEVPTMKQDSAPEHNQFLDQ